MQVALYFGSFNPVHLGHLAIARAVMAQKRYDQIWFIISPHNPLKAKDSLLGEEERKHLVELAITHESLMKASDIEFSLPKPSYTCDTMQVLVDKYPEYNFSIVMGGDSFASITKWKNYEELLAKYDIVLYHREGADTNLSLSKRLKVLSVPLIKISATQIRNKIKQGEAYRHLVPDLVWQKLEELEHYK